VKLSSASPTLLPRESVSQDMDKQQLTVAKKPNSTDSAKFKNLPKGALAVFGSTFITIFLSEMGDKTQVAILLMSAESQSPWLVFAGAASALITTSLLGVLLGRWLATKLSPQILNKAAGVSMLLITLQLVWEILHT